MRKFFDRPANHRASRVTILVAAAIAALITSLLVYLAAVAPRGVPTLDYYDVEAQFEDTSEIKLLSSVTVNGKRVGQVSEIRSEGGVSRLNLQLEPGTQLRADTTARIRIKNPVGAKYVDLFPGKDGAPLPDDGVLPVSQTSTAVDTPDLLATFDEDTRKNLSTSVEGLGRGFLGRGQEVNETLPEASEVLEDTRGAADAILARRGAAARFFPSLEQLAGAYDPVRRELAAGFRPQADVFGAFADRAGSLRRTLEAAPPALGSLRDGSRAAVPLLRETADFARAVARFSEPAPAGLRAATELLRTGGPALRQADPLLGAVGDSVRPTLALLGDLRPQIEPTLRALERQMRPLVELAGRHCDVLFQAEVWRSALSFGVPAEGDPTSDLDHDQGIGGNNNSFRVLGVPPINKEALLPDGAGEDPTIADNAYPAPCAAPKEFLP